MKARVEKKVGRNLTEGAILSTLFIFALPIVMTNLIQQLYALVDLVIIGKYVGSTGTVGVSTGGEMADLVTPVAMGFSTAGQVYIAQLTGAKEKEKIKKAINTLLSFMTIVACVLMMIAALFHTPILNMLNCPAEAMREAKAYMIITAVGFPAVFGYYAVCGILRGMGESKRPLLFIVTAAVINIFLDVILVAIFDLSAAGTAIATTASQYGSFIAAFLYMKRSSQQLEMKFSIWNMKIDTAELKVIVKLGVPQVCRSLLVRFSMLWVNSGVNAYGLAVSATNSVGNKIQKFAEVFMQGVDTATSAMIGQNLGARKPDRAKKTSYSALLLTLSSAFAVSALCLLFPRQIFGLINQDPEVMALGEIYLRIMIVHFFSTATLFPFQAMVTGSGFVTLGFAIGILDGVVCKVGLSLLFVNGMDMGYTGYFWATAFSRILPAFLCMGYFFSGKWRTRKLITGKSASVKE